jgi:UDP-N-acetylglucosamine 2-epimerase
MAARGAHARRDGEKAVILAVVASEEERVAASAFAAGAKEAGPGCLMVSCGSRLATDDATLGSIRSNILAGEGSATTRTALVMTELERIVTEEEPSGVVVFGAHEAALAATLVATKLHIPLWHAGAGRWVWGLRNVSAIHDAPPEDALIDSLASGMLAPTEAASLALAAARMDPRLVTITGPLEAEALERNRHNVLTRGIWAEHDLKPQSYVVASVRAHVPIPHQPLPVIDVDKMRYADRLSWIGGAAVAITDSVDLQIESCLLHVPCLVFAPGAPLGEIRAVGAAKLCPSDNASLSAAIAKEAARDDRDWSAPPNFDAGVSERMLNVMRNPAPITAAL